MVRGTGTPAVEGYDAGEDRKEHELKLPSSRYSLVDVYYWIRGKDIPYKIKYSRLSV